MDEAAEPICDYWPRAAEAVLQHLISTGEIVLPDPDVPPPSLDNPEALVRHLMSHASLDREGAEAAVSMQLEYEEQLALERTAAAGPSAAPAAFHAKRERDPTPEPSPAPARGRSEDRNVREFLAGPSARAPEPPKPQPPQSTASRACPSGSRSPDPAAESAREPSLQQSVLEPSEQLGERDASHGSRQYAPAARDADSARRPDRARNAAAAGTPGRRRGPVAESGACPAAGAATPGAPAVSAQHMPAPDEDHAERTALLPPTGPARAADLGRSKNALQPGAGDVTIDIPGTGESSGDEKPSFAPVLICACG